MDAMPSDSPRTGIQNEARLQALLATDLLDTAPEEVFDRCTRLASRVLGVPVAQITLVDRHRQFFKSRIVDGHPDGLRETPLSHSFCQHVVLDRAPLVVADARQHPILRHNPATEEFHVVAYLGVPLTTPDGHVLGSLCVVQSEARTWDAEAIRLLEDLAGIVMDEIQLRRTAHELQESLRDLRASELQRAELVDMLVHDLRNPLSSILVGLDLMAMSELTDVTRGDVAIAREGAEALIQMVNDILDVRKAEAGHLGLALDTCDLALVTAAAEQQVLHLAQAARVRLKRSDPSEAPVIEADAGKIRRLLVNLLSNAIQHTPPDGTVSLTVTTADDEVVFRVADTGEGIDGETLPRIFEKFRSQGTAQRGRRSAGLGLPFCKMVAEAHGGHIEVESTPGIGSVFRVRIPRRSRGFV